MTMKTQPVKRIYDIDPDGVIIRVEWVKLVPGKSLFIPAVSCTKAIAQVREIAASLDYELVHDTRIENHILGVRFWRTA